MDYSGVENSENSPSYLTPRNIPTKTNRETEIEKVKGRNHDIQKNENGSHHWKKCQQGKVRSARRSIFRIAQNHKNNIKEIKRLLYNYEVPHKFSFGHKTKMFFEKHRVIPPPPPPEPDDD